jgi:hypothetical protein
MQALLRCRLRSLSTTLAPTPIIRRLDMSEMHNLNAFRHSLNTLNYQTALQEFTALRQKSSLIGVISQKDIAAYLNLLTVVVTNPGLHKAHHPESLASLSLLARDIGDYVNANVWSGAVETNAIYIVCALIIVLTLLQISLLAKASNSEDAINLFSILSARKQALQAAPLPREAYEQMFLLYKRAGHTRSAHLLYEFLIENEYPWSSYMVKGLIECFGHDVKGAFDVCVEVGLIVGYEFVVEEGCF